VGRSEEIIATSPLPAFEHADSPEVQRGWERAIDEAFILKNRPQLDDLTSISHPEPYAPDDNECHADEEPRPWTPLIGA
jgi:hypothetical protein